MRKQKTRLSSVDISRGLAIALMIMAHIRAHMPVNLGLVTAFSGVLAAPFFLIVSGLSYELFLSSRIKKAIEPRIIRLEAFCRGSCIYTIPLIPYVIATVVRPEQFQFYFVHWGVFQVIGIGYIFGFLVPRDWRYKTISIISVFIITFLIHNFFYGTFGFLIHDYTPLFPWIGYFLFGRIVYVVYQNKYLQNDYKLLMVATLFLIVSFVIFDIAGISFNSATRDQVPMFLLLCSLQFFILSLFIIFVDHRQFCQRLFNPLERVGKIAFTAYYAHLPMMVAIEILSSMYSVPPISSLIFCVLIILIFAWIEKVWEKYDFKFGFEWMLRRGSQILMTFVQEHCPPLRPIHWNRIK